MLVLFSVYFAAIHWHDIQSVAREAGVHDVLKCFREKIFDNCKAVHNLTPKSLGTLRQFNEYVRLHLDDDFVPVSDDDKRRAELVLSGNDRFTEIAILEALDYDFPEICYRETALKKRGLRHSTDVETGHQHTRPSAPRNSGSRILTISLSLFVFVAALAGLVGTGSYLIHESDKNKHNALVGVRDCDWTYKCDPDYNFPVVEDKIDNVTGASLDPKLEEAFTSGSCTRYNRKKTSLHKCNVYSNQIDNVPTIISGGVIIALGVVLGGIALFAAFCNGI
eukprot:NODE_397_length_9427_cov_0.309605.p4 type:complete len:279 gc:universal NODE_397_length_9427_cov_0.309605:4064-3228(-)